MTEHLPYPMSETDDKWLTMKDWRSEWVGKIYDARPDRPWSGCKTVKLSGDLLMLDVCYYSRERPIPHTWASGTLPFLSVVHSIRVICHRDNSFLAKLEGMPHVPRSVKAPYRKENILKYLRSGDAWTYKGDMDKAQEAWDKYRANAA